MTRDPGPPVQRITVERYQSGWIIVRLDGEAVWRRFTRDEAFTRLWVCFPSNGSPTPKTRVTFAFVVLGGAWRPSATAYYGAPRGAIELPVPAPGDPETVWTLLDGLHGAPAVF